MRTSPAWLLLFGCTESIEITRDTFPAGGVWQVLANTDRGDVVYAGHPDHEVFEVAIHSWGRGSTNAAALRHRGGNSWDAAVDDAQLDVWGQSTSIHGGVDLVVDGPEAIDVEAHLEDGAVGLYDVDGFQVVSAGRIEGRGIRGDVDLIAHASGIDVEVNPYPGSTVRLEATGSVMLSLPFGLEYDLEAFLDPAWGAEITDLGFDTTWVTPDYVTAGTGSEAIRIEVTVREGTFFLWETPL